MRITLARVATAAAVLAAGTVGLASPNAAQAAPPKGVNTLSPASGNSGTTFTLLPPSGASCSGAGTSGYRWQTYMVSAAVDASTLTFGAGPNAIAGQYVQPLYDAAGGNPVINKNPAASPLGLITGIPTMSYASLVGITPPAGDYKIGFACTLSGAIENGNYWEKTITIAANGTSAGGPAGFIWGNSAAAFAPTLGATLTPGDATLSGTFTDAGLSIPAVTGYTVTAVPTAGTTVTASLPAGATNFTLTGLVNGTQYSVSMTATNSVGTSAASNTVTGTPSPGVIPAPSPFTATSGVGNVVLNWTPATVPAGATLLNHIVTVSPAVAGSPFTVPAGTNTLTVNAPAGSYSFTIQATYSPGYYTAAVGGPVSASSNSAQTIIQDITVVRPVGALVLTQRCGVYGSAAAVTDNVFGALPALAASPTNADPDPVNGYTYGGLPTGTPFGGQPSLDAGGTAGDPLFSQYPYPTLANGDATATYPTHCGIDLGTGKLITSGPKAGQYFTANGRMAQITVVNTQDVDNGFTVNGQMSTFTKNGTLGNTRDNSFSGNLLGWNPEVTYDSAPNLDGYDMVVVPGGVREPQASSSTTGLGAGSNVGNTSLSQALAKSNAYDPSANTGSLGMTVLDARLRLLIPVSADAGTYTGTLTFTTV